jgi:hypothetical protein
VRWSRWGVVVIEEVGTDEAIVTVEAIKIFVSIYLV